jgi:hypothetical protein
VDTLSVLEHTVSRRTPMTQGVALYETCRGSVCFTCKFCAADLRKSLVLKFALSTKWNVGVVLVELMGLTILEQLLVTRRFHVHGSLGGGNLLFSCHAKPFSPPNPGYHVWDLPLLDDLQHTVLCVEVQRCLDLRVFFCPACVSVRAV